MRYIKLFKDLVCRKICTYLVIFSHFMRLSIRTSSCVNVFWLGSDNQSPAALLED